MGHHSAGAPALLTPLQRADNLVVNTMNRRGQVLIGQSEQLSGLPLSPSRTTVRCTSLFFGGHMQRREFITLFGGAIT